MKNPKKNPKTGYPIKYIWFLSYPNQISNIQNTNVLDIFGYELNSNFESLQPHFLKNALKKLWKLNTFRVFYFQLIYRNIRYLNLLRNTGFIIYFTVPFTYKQIITFLLLRF